MSSLAWSDEFVLDVAVMDDTHREFVDLLARVTNASDADLAAAWQALIEHTQEHFDREDQWMQATRFAASNCHSTQHGTILQIMREGAERGQAGDLAVIRQMAFELGVWFPQHASSMDAALAGHLRNVGFDPTTGIVHLPQCLPREVIHGCGGASCSSPESETA